jgi:NAD(P)-dependent dehydrogenase (short-subunit alcohol dehydrogenase family)
MSPDNALRTALITGGGAGIGAAITRVLQREGIRCIITGRSSERPEGLNEETGYLPLDYLVPESVETAFPELRDTIRPDIVVNNAGINNKSAFGDVAAEQLEQTIAVNLTGPYRLTQACLPHMVEQSWGRIVNISSIWSVSGNPGNTSYCASKFGVDGFTVSLAAEVARKGVLVNCIAPGYIMSEVLRKKYSAEDIEDITKYIPIRRMGEPEEIAELAAWLVSARNTYVTGQNICADGGLSRTSQPWREW